MNKFINPWVTAKNFQDLGTFEDHTGYYELYCFDDAIFKHLAIGARYGEGGDYVSASLGLEDRMFKFEIGKPMREAQAVSSSNPAILEAMTRIKEKGLISGDVYYYLHGWKII